MNISIIGAGFAGLSTAKILKSFGHEVTIFEKQADVGGVWSASRRYPGLTTQNVRSTYAFSDFPYPNGTPEWPTGEQVQSYLAAYAHHFGLEPYIQLNTEVNDAQLNSAKSGWIIKTLNRSTGLTNTHFSDYLIICNGIFSQPFIPTYPGAEEFVQGGGRIYHTSTLHKCAEAKDKHVVVVGYGKSSCDVAQALCSQASSTQVVARQLIWKVPKKLMNVLNYKYLLLTRMGEGLFKYIQVKGFERFLHGMGKPVRNALLNQMQWVINKQCKLSALGLQPEGAFETIARSTVSLVTDGFYEAVAAGTIQVKKNTEIERLLLRDNQRFAKLSNGECIPVDLLICGTGWKQSVPFLSPKLNAKLMDKEGNFQLYRSMLPTAVPRLAFNGYNSSFFSQLNCEIGALWIADWLGGGLRLPSLDKQNKMISERLAWMEERTDGKHCKGTNIIPFSLHHIDELLEDLKLPLSRWIRLKQWFLPTNPADYAFITKALIKRYKEVKTKKYVIREIPTPE